MSRRHVFYVFALLFAVAAAYDALASIAPAIASPGPQWRRELLVVIDLAFIFLLLCRPLWLVWPFALLTLYSLWSHGTHAWLVWHRVHGIDWLSLAVILVMPVILGTIIWDARSRSLGAAA